MPKSETSNPNEHPSFSGPRYRPNWVAAALSFIFGAYLTVALLAYSPMQSGFHTTNPTARNPVGWMGANAIWTLLYSIGISTWLLPVFIGWVFYLSVRSSRHLTSGRTIAMVITCVSCAGLAAMVKDAKWASDYFPNGPGGLVGLALYHQLLEDALGAFGTGLLLGTVYCGALLFIFTKDIGTELEKIFTNFSAWRAERAKLKVELEAQRAKEREAQAKQKTAAPAVTAPVTAPPATAVGPTGRKTFVPKPAEDPLAKSAATRSDPAGLPPPSKAKPEAAPAPALKLGAGKSAAEPDKKPEPKVELNIVKPEEPKKAKHVVLPQSDDANYQFPPLNLLKEQTGPASGNSEAEHRTNAENLLRILSEFGVEVTLGEIHVGPVITRYEVVPAPGVRVEKSRAR
jgi:S-DNA-T family DNA segregation ATPase FtsK/SpoIIIE